MANAVLILGGYGNFGRRISFALAKANIPLIIAGRNQAKTEELAHTIRSDYPTSQLTTASFDVHKELAHHLDMLKPRVIINTCGPFQTTDYSVAETCIKYKIHYLDLSDGRDFVTGVTTLDKQAKEAGVMVVSGASTVPGLSSAVLEHYKGEFSQIESLLFGISPGAKASRGLATAQAILTYLGKPLKPYSSSKATRYGWQDIYRQEYPMLGKRWMANCDIPDLDLFPEKYGINHIRFSAGMESSLLHLGMWILSWLVRLGLPLNLPHYASFLLKLSTFFDAFGTPDGGMHMIISGKDATGKSKQIQWFIIARDGDGPHISTIPAIILAKKLARGEPIGTGAMPCIGLVTLAEYLEELKGYNVTEILL